MNSIDTIRCSQCCYLNLLVPTTGYLPGDLSFLLVADDDWRSNLAAVLMHAVWLCALTSAADGKCHENVPSEIPPARFSSAT